MCCSCFVNEVDSSGHDRVEGHGLRFNTNMCSYLSVFHSFISSVQISTNAKKTMEVVITSAGTRWAPSNAAARKATNCLLMSGHAKVSD